MKTKLFIYFAALFFLVFAEVSFAKINVKSTLPWMQNLGDAATCVINNAEFQKEVSAIEKFDYSKKNGREVVAALVAADGVTLRTYKTKSPWSKAIAYTPRGVKEVYYNLRKNPRDFKEMINTTIHEILHTLGFEHGGNSWKGKGNSVNYLVGSIAEKYVLNCSKGFGI